MAYGKIGNAPCGHPGEAVIGQYFECSIGCDHPDYVELALQDDVLACPRCLSTDLDEEYDFVAVWFGTVSPVPNSRCNPCGHVWVR